MAKDRQDSLAAVLGGAGGLQESNFKPQQPPERFRQRWTTIRRQNLLAKAGAVSVRQAHKTAGEDDRSGRAFGTGPGDGRGADEPRLAASRF
jgi:hypothetical protein